MSDLDLDAIETRTNDLRSLARRGQIFAPEMTVPHLCSDIDALIVRVRELESVSEHPKRRH